MCKHADEKSYWEGLTNFLTRKLNANFQEYDLLRAHIDKLMLANNAYRGPLFEGATSMIMNRVNGAYTLYKSPQAFYNAGINGYKWAYYYSLSPALRDDVRDAGLSAIYSHLWPISLTGLAKATVTGYKAYNGSADQLALLAKQRVHQQRDALGVSVVMSMGITTILKKVGTYAKTDIQRVLVKGALRSWQVTALLGICYGLSRLDDTMRETGVFGSTLVTARDKFYLESPNPTIQQFETVLKNWRGGQ